MAGWIVVVDDDVINIKTAGNILSSNNMRVTGIRSGAALLDFIKENDPDLILLDIMMPDMDGYETFRRLRIVEKELGRDETPVVFLTADSDIDSEIKSLDVGASDFIRKPFIPEAFVKRIENILSNSERIKDLNAEAKADSLTRLMNRATVDKMIENAMRSRTGTLMMIDLDSFKLINDIYGHDGGDKILVAFSSILKSNMRSDDIVGRAGGDEFLAFITGHNEKSIAGLTERFNTGILEKAKEFFGDEMKVPLGVSVGAVYSQAGDELADLYKMADEALYDVKLNGKHSYRIYSDMQKDDKEGPDDIDDISRVLEERNAGNYALWLGQDAFSNIYRFIIRYIQSYHSVAYKLLFTVVCADDESKAADPDTVSAFGEVLNKSLRKSDIMMQSGRNQYFLLLPELSDKYINDVTERILNSWESSKKTKGIKILSEAAVISYDDMIGDDSWRRDND